MQRIFYIESKKWHNIHGDPFKIQKCTLFPVKREVILNYVKLTIVEHQLNGSPECQNDILIYLELMVCLVLSMISGKCATIIDKKNNSQKITTIIYLNCHSNATKVTHFIGQ